MNAIVPVSAWTFGSFLLLGLMAGATVLLLLSGGTVWLLRKQSAALRHRIWTLAMSGLLVLPVLAMLLPNWGPQWQPNVPPVAVGAAGVPFAAESLIHSEPLSVIRPSGPAEAIGVPSAGTRLHEPPPGPLNDRDTDSVSANPVAAADAGNRPAATRPIPSRRSSNMSGPSSAGEGAAWRLAGGAAVLWLAGVVLGVMFWVRRLWSGASLVRRAVPADGPEIVAIRDQLRASAGVAAEVPVSCSSEIAVPLTVGCLHPVILLPAGYGQWTGERLRVVLAHELAHIARRDVLWQLVARLACCLYWCHPLVWLASRRMRIEREFACDDAVLAMGEVPDRYATHLVDVAASLRDRSPLSPAAVAMAGRSSLEGRVRAILHPALKRTPVTSRTGRLLIAGTLAVVVALSLMVPSTSQKADAGAEAELAERMEDRNSTTEEQSTGSNESIGSDESTDSDPPAEEQVDTATITGTVVDMDDAPAAGVRVSTQWYQGQDEALTDDAGRFQLEVPRERIIGRTVHASAESGRLQAQHQLPWDIDKTENPSGIRLQLHPAQRVELNVVDAEGKPVAGATAGLLANYGNFDHGATDGSGRIVFMLPHDLTVTNVYAFADHKGMDYRAYVLPRGRDRDQNAEPPKLPQEPIRLTLDGAKPLTVRVQEPDESPIVGISLYPWLVKKPDQPQDLNLSYLTQLIREETDASGTAVFNWIPHWNERSIEVWPQDEKHVRQRGSYDPKAGDGTLTMTLDSLVPIGGRVTMPDGSPAAGITISAKGRGHQFDDFRGSATTDADGRYEIKAAPNMVYLLTASGSRLAAAPHTAFAVWPDQPRDDLDFQLRPATRLFGRVTMGDERKPVEGQRIYAYQYGSGDLELKDINLPNPEGSRTSTRPYIVHNTVTDADGRFEILVGSGKFDIRGPSQNEIEKFEIADETEREFNFHTVRPETGLLAGKVVAAETREPVPEAEVDGIYRHALAGPDMKATTDRSGKFKVERELHRTVIHARSQDGTLAGVVEIGPDDKAVTIPIRPPATAHGRLINQATGESMPGEEIRYGVEVHLGDDDAPFRTSFGGTTTTDDEGRFRLKDLILGQDYSVTVTIRRSDNPNDVSWHGIGHVVPEEARDIDLGDMQLKPAYRSPTIGERVAGAFSSKKTPVERYNSSRSDAGLSHQHVLILFGDPDSNAVKQFMELRYGESDVRRAFDPFQFLAVDSSAGKLSAARELADQLDLWLGDGREVFSVIITDAAGQPLANADAGRLMYGGTISREKVTAFLAEHTPQALDAQTLLDEALARAKTENKRVIVQETATWCGPCWRLSRFLNAHRDKWEGDYILVKMDHRWTGSREIMEKLRDGAEGGVPWWAILNADGDILITSNDSDGDNIGFPSSADGRAHFRTMLEKTALRMTDNRITELVEALTDHE